MKFLAAIRGDIPQEYLKDIPLSQLTPYEIDFVQKMGAQKILMSPSPHMVESTDIRLSTNQSRRS